MNIIKINEGNGGRNPPEVRCAGRETNGKNKIKKTTGLGGTAEKNSKISQPMNVYFAEKNQGW